MSLEEIGSPEYYCRLNMQIEFALSGVVCAVLAMVVMWLRVVTYIEGGIYWPVFGTALGLLAVSMANVIRVILKQEKMYDNNPKPRNKRWSTTDIWYDDNGEEIGFKEAKKALEILSE